jgi:hypothetical protein
MRLSLSPAKFRALRELVCELASDTGRKPEN